MLYTKINSFPQGIADIKKLIQDKQYSAALKIMCPDKTAADFRNEPSLFLTTIAQLFTFTKAMPISDITQYYAMTITELTKFFKYNFSYNENISLDHRDVSNILYNAFKILDTVANYFHEDDQKEEYRKVLDWHSILAQYYTDLMKSEIRQFKAAQKNISMLENELRKVINKQGLLELKKENYVRAVSFFKSAYYQFPNDPLALKNLVFTSIQTEDHDAAEKYAKILLTNKQFPDKDAIASITELDRMYRQQARYHEIKPLLDILAARLSATPLFYKAEYLLANYEYEFGDPTSAQRMFEDIQVKYDALLTAVERALLHDSLAKIFEKTAAPDAVILEQYNKALAALGWPFPTETENLKAVGKQFFKKSPLFVLGTVKIFIERLPSAIRVYPVEKILPEITEMILPVLAVELEPDGNKVIDFLPVFKLIGDACHSYSLLGLSIQDKGSATEVQAPYADAAAFAFNRLLLPLQKVIKHAKETGAMEILSNALLLRASAYFRFNQENLGIFDALLAVALLNDQSFTDTDVSSIHETLQEKYNYRPTTKTTIQPRQDFPEVYADIFAATPVFTRLALCSLLLDQPRLCRDHGHAPKSTTLAQAQQQYALALLSLPELAEEQKFIVQLMLGASNGKPKSAEDIAKQYTKKYGNAVTAAEIRSVSQEIVDAALHKLTGIDNHTADKLVFPADDKETATYLYELFHPNRKRK